MHEVWAFPIVIVGPMVQWLLTHWILKTKTTTKTQSTILANTLTGASTNPSIKTKTYICLGLKYFRA